MCPRGAPDYSNVRAYGPLHRLDDQAELAARLNSPVSYDRSGRLIWMTTFEHGLQGAVPGVDSVDSVYEVSSAQSHYSPFSLTLNPSSDEGSYVEWGTIVEFIEEGKVALEAVFAHDSNPYGIRLKLLYFDGSTQQRAELHYDPQTGDWTVRTGETTWETILEGYKLQQGKTCWNHVKLVVDFQESTYVRVQIGRRVVKIEEYEVYSLDSENLGQMVCRFMAYGGTEFHAAVYLDAIIVTQAEE